MAVKQYKIKVVSNPDFCGIDAGGVQFAHGEAIIPEGRMVEWFMEHDGYEVSEVVKKEVDEASSEEVADESPKKGGRKAKEAE